MLSKWLTRVLEDLLESAYWHMIGDDYEEADNDDDMVGGGDNEDDDDWCNVCL